MMRNIMKRKKKGSSIVLVVFVAAIMITTATMMLTVVSNDYKIRVNRSKQVKNLYEADSGQNYVKNIIQKLCDLAIIAANNKVRDDVLGNNEEYVDGAELKDDAYDRANRIFKEYFIKLLMKADIGGAEIKDKYRNPDNKYKYDGDDSFKFLEYCIDNLEYRYLNNASTDINSLVKDKSYLEEKSFIDSSDSDLKVKVTDSEVYINDSIMGDAIVLTVQSTFKNRDRVDTSLTNKKTIQVKYTITAPDYEPNFTGTTENAEICDYGFNRAITADGDMKVNDGNVNISGAAWVKGSTEAGNKDSKNKYNGGVFIDKSKLDIDYLYTNGSLALINNADVHVKKDAYCLNTYFGSYNGGSSSDNKLNVDNNLVTNNDIAINSKDSQLKLGSYYGINDKYFQGEGSVEEGTAVKQASSLILNNVENNSVNIDNAYIAGVSYINFKGDKYQTGESVGVKGNYKAYTDVLPQYSEIEMADYGDNKLIEGTLKDKAQYFVDYYDNNDVIQSEIVIKNIKAAGAYVKNEGNKEKGKTNADKNTLTTDEISKIIKPKQTEFTKEVLCMGNTLGLNKSLENIYNNYEVTRMVAKKVNGISPVINFNEYDEDIVYSSEIIANRTFYNYIYNPFEDNTIVIKSDGIYIKDSNGDYIKDKNNKEICIKSQSKVTGNKERYVEAVIITKGNVVFEGDEDINLYGAIVSGGNVTFNSKGNVNIIYGDVKVDTDKEWNVEDSVSLTISQFINKNTNPLYGVFSSIYPSGHPNNRGNVVVAFHVTTNSDVNIYNTEKYLKEGLWKIISDNE